MSSDNFYLIRKDRQGYFVPVMGFASDEVTPIITSKHARFKELLGALEFAESNYTEYGITIHEECYSEETPVFEKPKEGHFVRCPLFWQEQYDKQYTEEEHKANVASLVTLGYDEEELEEVGECNCDDLKAEWEKDFSDVAM